MDDNVVVDSLRRDELFGRRTACLCADYRRNPDDGDTNHGPDRRMSVHRSSDGRDLVRAARTFDWGLHCSFFAGNGDYHPTDPRLAAAIMAYFSMK